MDPNKFEAPAFDPRDPAYRGRLWTRVEAPDGSVQTVVFWRRVGLAALALALLGWLASAGAIWLFFRWRQDFTEVSYLNLVWPPRWPEHRAALGRHYIVQGRDALTHREFLAAARLYGAGLSRVPDDVTARRELAFIYFRFGRLDQAIGLLDAGFDQAVNDLEYVKFSLSLLTQAQEDNRIIALAKRHLPPVPDENKAHLYLALGEAGAYFARGNYDLAEQTVKTWHLGRSLEGQLLLAKCDWERGYPDLALSRLQAQRALFPDRDELSLQLIRFYRALGRHNEALNESVLRYTADPASPGPRCDLIYAFAQKGDQARTSREIESYLADFPQDATALLLLAGFASDNANLPLVRRIREVALAHRLPPNGFDLTLIQTLIAAGDYAGAQAAAEAALAGPAGKQAGFASVLSGLRALACYGTGDAANGQGYLQVFLQRENPHADDARYLADKFLAFNAREPALLVLRTAVAHDSLNQSALTELVRIEADAGDQTGLLADTPRLLAMRKPSRAVLQEAYLKLTDATPDLAALRKSIRISLESSPTEPEPGT